MCIVSCNMVQLLSYRSRHAEISLNKACSIENNSLYKDSASFVYKRFH